MDLKVRWTETTLANLLMFELITLISDQFSFPINFLLKNSQKTNISNFKALLIFLVDFTLGVVAQIHHTARYHTELLLTCFLVLCEIMTHRARALLNIAIFFECF